jgi:hypothetical protein
VPIFKYKTFEDAEKALWNLAPDEQYFERVATLWEFANQINPISIPKGIYKFKTIKEANQHREEIEMAHVKKLLSAKTKVNESKAK